MQFSDLGLIEALLRALRDEGYATPTPIQAQAIPHVLKGRDLLGCAQTGTGKTAAFALPILQRLEQPAIKPGSIRVLVLAPTRELAAQIGDGFRAYGRHLRHPSTVIFGGVSQFHQEQALARRPEILIATPGRLLDLMGQGFVRLDALEVLVLDEADRMLDMGFIHDIRRVLQKVPPKRQTLFFSATMPPPIRQLADGILHSPVEVAVAPVSSAAETVHQSVYFVAKPDKGALLRHLLGDAAVSRALVFTRTKHGADKVAKQLLHAQIRAEAIHGNKSQNARTRALDGFKKGTVRVLVASDIASRGIDVDLITHVVNYDLPNEPETYVHRIGRTGRAGASGTAWSFCDHEERAYLRDIERTIRKNVPVVDDHPFRMSGARPAHGQPQQAPRHQQHGHAQRAQHAPRHQHAPHRGDARHAPQAPRRDDAQQHGDRRDQPEQRQGDGGGQRRSVSWPGRRGGRPSQW
jgi:ATP-dependent RNA helicase RhlE